MVRPFSVVVESGSNNIVEGSIVVTKKRTWCKSNNI